MQAVGHLSLDQHGEPVHEPDHGGGDSAKHHPDEERDREEQAKDDRQAAPCQIVANDESNGPLLDARHRVAFSLLGRLATGRTV